MIDFNEMNEKYIVRYDESKSCMFAYLWSKKDWPCYKDGKKGLWDGDFGWISVSEAYTYMKDKGHHFYPAGRYKETYIDAYKLNETFGDCIVFKQKKEYPLYWILLLSYTGFAGLCRPPC